MYSARHENPERRSWYSIKSFLLILLLAFGVRLHWMITQKGVIENEGGEYARLADNMMTGKGYVSSLEEQPNLMYAPLYPILISLVTYFSRDSELAGRLVSVVSGAFLTLPMYFIALRLYGKRAAFICAGLAALHPLLVGFSTTVLTEATYLTLMMAGVYFGSRCLELDSSSVCVLAGIFFGLAYLTRPEAVALSVLTVAWMIVLGCSDGRAFRRLIRYSAVLTTSFVLVALPYVFFLRAQTGKFMLEAKSKLNYTIGTRFNAGMPYNQAAWGIGQDLSEEGPLRESYRYAGYTPYPAGIGDIARYLVTTAKRNRQGVYEIFTSSYGFGTVLLGLAFLGWFGEAWDRYRLNHELFLFSVLLFVVLLLMSAHLLQFRYFLPALPILIIWASKGIQYSGEWVRTTAANLVGKSVSFQTKLCTSTQFALVFIILVSATRAAGASELTQGSKLEFALKEAGIWLRQSYPGDKTVMTANSIVIPYYSRGTMMVLPYADSDLALKYIHKKSPNFIVLEGRTLNIRPYVREWIENGVPDPAAQLIYWTGNSIEEKIAIFKFNRSSASN